MKVWATAEMREFLASGATDGLRAPWPLAAPTGLQPGHPCDLGAQAGTLEASDAPGRRDAVPAPPHGPVSCRSAAARLTCRPATVHIGTS